jgi:hypothetical protein
MPRDVIMAKPPGMTVAFQISVAAGILSNCGQELSRIDLTELSATIERGVNFAWEHYPNKHQFNLANINRLANAAMSFKREWELIVGIRVERPQHPNPETLRHAFVSLIGSACDKCGEQKEHPIHQGGVHARGNDVA